MKRTAIVLAVLAGAFLPAAALDREAFTITRYHLDVQIDRTSHVMAVTGKLTLRNDSGKPQKNIALQVSSSLAWNNIMLANAPLPWLGDNYTSDIDHTGSLSEAIVTLPKELPPAGLITLGVQYGGTITPDTTRLTRVGTPAQMAERSDWDQISDSFTAVRGLGYVVWYPVAIEAVSMSDGNAVFDAIAAWKRRQARSEFFAYLGVLVADQHEQPCIESNLNYTGPWRVAAGSSPEEAAPAQPEAGHAHTFGMTLQTDELGDVVPTFTVLPSCSVIERPTINLAHTPEHTQLARDYALAAESNDPLLHDWLGESGGPVRVVELADQDALPYQSGAMLFTPLRPWPTDTLQLLLMPMQVSARLHSPHPWILEGMQRFLQALSVESHSGRKAALDYLDDLRAPLVKAETAAHPPAGAASKAAAEADNTLLNTSDELYLRGKGSFVFWMLRDMLGDSAMQAALANYRRGADNDPAYLQRLLQTSSKRDLEWFFDDWVYRDRGLPDFHMVSAYSRTLLSESNKSFLLTVTIENRGRAGAEVPIMVQTPSGAKTIRVLVKAGEKATARTELPIAPDKITVNDGSVPEANLGNNVYQVAPPAKE